MRTANEKEGKKKQRWERINVGNAKRTLTRQMLIPKEQKKKKRAKNLRQKDENKNRKNNI